MSQQFDRIPFYQVICHLDNLSVLTSIYETIRYIRGHFRAIVDKVPWLMIRQRLKSLDLTQLRWLWHE